MRCYPSRYCGIKHTVVFITLPNSDPPASTTAFRFFNACVVWSSTPPSTTCIVAGSNGMHPEQKSKFPALIACE